MGLFKKKKNEKNINETNNNEKTLGQNITQAQPEAQVQNIEQVQSAQVNQTQQPQNTQEPNVEVLEFDEKETKQVPINDKKENRLLFIIIAFLIVFVLFLPTITSYVSKNSIFTYNRETDVETNKIVDGMLEIGSNEGSITVKNIQFYNATKKQKNEISIIYLPEKGIKNVEDLNIYIEIYNSNKMLIYRTPYDVSSVERKVQGTFTIQLNETIYHEATYIKISIIDEEDFDTKTDTLTCTNITSDDNYRLTEKITYNFSNNGLINYQVNKYITELEKEGDTEVDDETITNKYETLIKEEGTEISKTNVSDLEYDDESITYTIDIKTFTQGKSNYIKLYNLGSVKRQVKLTEEAKGWSCN